MSILKLNSEGNRQPVERVTKEGARCKATSPGDHPGKTVLHSLELKHVPNCDTMQQGVAGYRITCEFQGECTFEYT